MWFGHHSQLPIFKQEAIVLLARLVRSCWWIAVIFGARLANSRESSGILRESRKLFFAQKFRIFITSLDEFAILLTVFPLIKVKTTKWCFSCWHLGCCFLSVASWYGICHQISFCLFCLGSCSLSILILSGWNSWIALVSLLQICNVGEDPILLIITLLVISTMLSHCLSWIRLIRSQKHSSNGIAYANILFISEVSRTSQAWLRSLILEDFLGLPNVNIRCLCFLRTPLSSLSSLCKYRVNLWISQESVYKL